jgi:hypothetical protein
LAVQEPAAVVLAFIADHFRWNTAAHQRSERSRRSEAAGAESMEVAEHEYAALLARYCRPGFVGEPIAFGIPPLHDPAHEAVVSARLRGERCFVRTRLTRDIAGVQMVQDFEYRLSRAEGRWYLESVKCVVGGGRYESL